MLFFSGKFHNKVDVRRIGHLIACGGTEEDDFQRRDLTQNPDQFGLDDGVLFRFGQCFCKELNHQKSPLHKKKDTT
jgi:hypothetical protein